MFAQCMCLVETNTTTTKINCNFNYFSVIISCLSGDTTEHVCLKLKFRDVNSVTSIDVSHTYYKCKLRPNQNAHIKCFEPNTHIHCICTVSSLHQNAAHKICRVSDSTIFDLTFKTGSINQYFVLNIYDVQK